ncbi:MAG: M56 family metallopeptidase [Verrucomicrobium sp.]
MIHSLLTPPSGETALGFLGSFLLQATALMLVCLLVLRWAGRRWSASNRHVLLLGTALLLPCLLPCSLALDQQGLTWTWLKLEPSAPPAAATNAGSWKLAHVSSGGTPPAHEVSTPFKDSSETPVSRGFNDILNHPAKALLLIWLTGAMLGGVWLLLGLAQLAWVALTATRGSQELQQAMQRQRDRWAPGARVRLLMGRQGEIPMTWGILTHFITLPPESTDWEPSTWRAVLRHELSHVARRDFAWLTLARAATLVCWFHPLAWWLKRELTRSAEHACDDLATRTPAGRAAYARSLVQVVSQSHRPAFTLASPFRLALAMAGSSALRSRVEALMDASRNRATYQKRQMLWQAPACGALLLALGTMTACKEKAVPASEHKETTSAAAARETRIYRLSEGQRSLLLAGSNDKKAPLDPFGMQPVKGPSAEENEKTLSEYSAKASLHLTKQAHISTRQGEPPTVEMTDARTLIVTTDEKTHSAIAKYLAQHESGQQVMIRSYMLEVAPGWLPWRDLGLQEPAKDSPAQVQGVLTQEQGQKLMAFIRSDNGVQNLTAAPSVTTRSGQRTHVEMVREFIYPTEFDPPQVLQPPQGGDGKVNPALANLPVMPTTPTAFEMRPVGLHMEYDPTVLPDNTHRIELYWQITEFLGFMNYGTPIKTTATDRDGKVQELIISENKVQQPVFETMKLTTSFDVPDGGYVVIGGVRPERQSPATLDTSSGFVPATPFPRSGDRSKPVMYILILQPTLLKNPAQP